MGLIFNFIFSMCFKVLFVFWVFCFYLMILEGKVKFKVVLKLFMVQIMMIGFYKLFFQLMLFKFFGEDFYVSMIDGIR